MMKPRDIKKRLMIAHRLRAIARAHKKKDVVKIYDHNIEILKLALIGAKFVKCNFKGMQRLIEEVLK